jgi:hypothetical protein
VYKLTNGILGITSCNFNVAPCKELQKTERPQWKFPLKLGIIILLRKNAVGQDDKNLFVCPES